MIVVLANDYLDARRPDWIDAELCGRVVYQRLLKTVAISDREIERVLAQQGVSR